MEIVVSKENDGLPPLPLIPYAMSLSTTMIYRAFSDEQRGLSVTLRSLGRCCRALENLSNFWTSAKGISKLAKRLLNVLANHEKARDKTAGLLGDSIRDREDDAGRRNPARTDAPSEFPVDNSETDSTIQLPLTNAATGTHPQPDLLPQVPGQFDAHGNWQINSSYAQLNQAFGDLFEYNMPTAFRDPATWEVFHYMNDDFSPASSSFQIPPYLLPEMDFGPTN